MRVLLVADHPIVRRAWYGLLEAPDIEIVGEAGNGREAIELMRRLQPEVILMDARMPEMDGGEATRVIHAEAPGIWVIGLSTFEHAVHGEAMQAAGAVAYLSKSAPASELLGVIRSHYQRTREQMPPAAAA